MKSSHRILAAGLEDPLVQEWIDTDIDKEGNNEQDFRNG